MIFKFYLLLGLVYLGYYYGNEKPNIIFILADDLGYGDVGFNGQKHILTPRLDQMAKEGMILKQHYSGNTVCMPSRGSFLTGYDMGHAKIRGNPGVQDKSAAVVDLDGKDQTVAKELKRAGYQTAVIGKWGMEESGDGSGWPDQVGFDYFFGIDTHYKAHHYYPKTLHRNREEVVYSENEPEQAKGTNSHDEIMNDALRYVEKRSQDKQPFFLFLTPTLPHLELTIEESAKKQYQGLGWPERPMKKGHYINDPEGNVTYAAMVSRLDRDVGKLLDLLKAKGVAEKTMVIFSSDNGPEYEQVDGFFNSNGIYRGGKRDLYEGGIRVPTVVWWPGHIKAGVANDHMSAFWDWYPTLCEAAGVTPNPTDLSGFSILPSLLGKECQHHETLYWEFNEREGPLQAVRFGKWKAIQRYDKPMELYDLNEDPSEERDISQQNVEQVEKAKKYLMTLRTESEAFPLVQKKSMNKKKGELKK
jgi:arylsulfatase A-like enzyme